MYNKEDKTPPKIFSILKKRSPPLRHSRLNKAGKLRAL